MSFPGIIAPVLPRQEHIMDKSVTHTGFCKACIEASKPISSGHNITINGIGGMFYGSRDPCPTCGSVVQSQWFCILFIPLFRVGRYRVKYLAPNRYLSREIPQPRKPGKQKVRRRRFTCPLCGCLGGPSGRLPSQVKMRLNQSLEPRARVGWYHPPQMASRQGHGICLLTTPRENKYSLVHRSLKPPKSVNP